MCMNHHDLWFHRIQKFIVTPSNLDTLGSVCYYACPAGYRLGDIRPGVAYVEEVA